MSHGWVIACTGRRTIHQNMRTLKTVPAIQGDQRTPRPTFAGSAGPGVPFARMTRSGTSATKTSGQSRAFGNVKERSAPDAAAASGRHSRLMKADLAAGLGGLVDGVDDPHELAPFFGAGHGALALGDAAEEIVQLLLVGLLVDVPRRLGRG